MTAVDGTEFVVSRWSARCKDCGREGRPGEFVYADAWLDGVLERGGTRSDRCPECRQRHSRDAQTMAVPYFDLDVIGVIDDTEQPTGRLGGLGPLPVKHKRHDYKPDTEKYDFGLTVDHVHTLSRELETKQVAVVVAGTGSGKSTFLPYRLLVPPSGCLRLADHGPIVVTEPRQAAAIDNATFVAEKIHGAPSVGAGCDIGYRVKDKPAFDGACRLLYVTDGSLVNWIRQGLLNKFGAIIVDEAHELNKNIELILAALRTHRKKHPQLRIIIASATVNEKFFVEYFGGPEEVFLLSVDTKKKFGYGEPLWPGQDIPTDHPDWTGGELNGRPLTACARTLQELRVVTEEVPQGINYKNWIEQMPKLVAEQAIALHRGTDYGDILAFLPTETTINDAVKLIDDEVGREVAVLPLLRNAPQAIQIRAREERPPGAPRRIVVSTNIAETSLTIDGITFVIDSGLICQSRWDSATATKRMPMVAHSQDGVRQRWGRVGRKAPGFVLPLYTHAQFLRFDKHTLPESARDDLEQFALNAAAIGIDDAETVVFPAQFRTADGETNATADAFERELNRSGRALRARGVLDPVGDITLEGAELLAYQGAMSEAGALIGADELCCSVEMAVALALLTERKPIGWLLRFNSRWDATARNAVRRQHEMTYAGCRDDLDLVLKVFGAWERASDPEAWASERYISHAVLSAASEAKDTKLKFLAVGRSERVTQPVRPELAERVRAVLARSFADFTYVRDGDAWRPLNADSDVVFQLDRFARTPRGDRIVALQRMTLPRQPQVALLSSVVETPEWAAKTDSWAELIAAAVRLRAPDGELEGADLDAHWAHSDWFVGLRAQCTVSREGDSTRLAPVELLESRAPLSLPDDEIDENADAEATEEAVADEAKAGEEAPGAKPHRIRTRPGPQPARGGDIAPLPSKTEVVYSTEGEERFKDIASEECNDAPRASEPAADEPSRSAVSVGPLARTVDGQPLRNGVARVVGAAGIGNSREVIVVMESEDGSLRVLAESGVGVGGDINATCAELVTSWGRPFIVAYETRTAYELALGADELTLSKFDTDIAELVPVGAQLRLQVTELDVHKHSLRATRLPFVSRHLRLATRGTQTSRSGGAESYPAKLAGEGPVPDTVWAVLDHGEPETGLVHRFSLKKHVLAKVGLPGEPGLPLRIELVADAKKRHNGTWPGKTFTRIPNGVQALCKEDVLRLDEEAGRLDAAPLMTTGLRDRLLALSDDSSWRAATHNLWRETNALVHGQLAASDETADFDHQPWREARASKEALIEAAEELAEVDDVLAHVRRHHDLMDQWRELPSAGPADMELRARFQDVRERFNTRCGELMAANARERERLCANAEALSDVRLAQALTRVREIQEAWKQTDIPGREQDEALFTRFRSAVDAIYTRRSSEQAANAAAKERLVEEAEQRASWEDTEAAVTRVHGLIEQLKAIGPAGKHVDDALRERVQGAKRNAIDARRRARDAENQRIRDENAAAKEPLVSAAERCVYWEDTEGALTRIRELIERLKAIDSAGKEREDRFWERLRQANGAVFRRRDESRSAAKWELVAEAERLSGSTDWATASRRLPAIRDELKRIGRAGDAEDAIWGRFNSANDEFYERRNAQWQANAHAKEQLVMRAEALIEHWDRGYARAEIRRINAEWKSIGPARREDNDRLWARLRAAGDRIFARL
jgi:HrpA-like RNA helicase